MQSTTTLDPTSPYLRDLLWLLEAPDLITSPFAGKPDLEFLGWNPDEISGWLSALENKRTHLETRLADSGRQRLGVYHEALWQLLLEEAPAIQLLGHHLPIRENKRTLGELDFLYRHQPTHRIYHLEVAIKYYLGLPEGPGQSQDLCRWIGPAGLDSLAIKVAHTEQKQLPLSDHPLTRQQLKPLLKNSPAASLETEIHKQLALPGVLFYPWHAPMPTPQRASKNHLRGWWLHFPDWPDFLASFNEEVHGKLLGKPHWLASPLQEELLEPAELEKILQNHFKERGWPLQLALFSPSRGWQRVFLVNNQWPQQIPLPPG
ncbi:DUF1853 family protein [Marinospirillum sp.]|uniref:DUF1853 family protein n=1 Tax=Marinospirillum sp. TaxID=2183934 RepID=UPI00286FF3E3|nr:DUF1853 family protein [Marinospirillum sp.]MDR9469362.1 DUF1853 family protein [Marinospirillum sp.]